MPTQEQTAAAHQRAADATARMEASLNLPPPPPQAAALPPNFQAAFPPDSPPVLGHTGPNVAIHSRIGDRVIQPHVGPVNRITTDHTGRATGGGTSETLKLWVPIYFYGLLRRVHRVYCT